MASCYPDRSNLGSTWLEVFKELVSYQTRELPNQRLAEPTTCWSSELLSCAMDSQTLDTT